MKINEQKVKDYLKSKNICECPMCHAKEGWSVIDDLIPVPIPIDMGNRNFMYSMESFNHLPLIAISCNHCGTVQFLNEVSLGL